MSLTAVPMLAEGEGVFSFLHTMPGPDFLWLFGGWFVLTFGTVLVLRWRGHDTPLTTGVGLLCFEALGAARMIVGSAHGMHQWDFLIFMMVGGAVLFFLRAQSSGKSGGSDGGSLWSSCSSRGWNGSRIFRRNWR